MKEQDVQRASVTIRAKASGDDLEDIVAVVVAKDGEGGIAADGRLTVPMLSYLCRRHGIRAVVYGGAVATDSSTFVRGDGGQSLESLRESLGVPDDAEMVLYTFGLLSEIAKSTTSNHRWDFP